MSFLDCTGPGGFTPGSKEAMRAVHCEHRYELKAVAQQAAAIHPVGRRNLIHVRQAEIDAGNAAKERRQLQGRRSGAALEWLLKRQQERNYGEQQEVQRPMHRGAGVLSHSYTSPSNPLFIQQPHTHRADTPTPQEMAAALAAMELSQAAGIPTPAAAAAAAAPERAAAEVASTSPCSSGSSFSSTDTGATTPGALASDGEESDAVAVVADLVGDAVAVPTHLKCHLETSNLAPVQSEPHPRHTPCQTATQAAYWRQQEMDELLGALLERYPHGIPKKMLLDLRQLGINDAPGLGFGCSSSSLSFDTLLLRKPM